MKTPTLLPAPNLDLDLVLCSDTILTLSAFSRESTAPCPVCATSSARVHSRYRRLLDDLPMLGVQVQILLTVRRFFCDAPKCTRRIFAERVGELAAPFARSTSRLTAIEYALGLAQGGEAGSRFAARLAVPISPDTLLRRVRQAPLPARPTPRILGVDDFAFKRGHRYGTILVDLETHEPVDLLEDRLAETFAEWLRRHPGVEVISRDRARAYAQGGAAGAPEAQHVADRFHLLKNLSESVERAVAGHHARMRDALRPPAAQPESAPPLEADPSPPSPAEAPACPPCIPPEPVPTPEQALGESSPSAQRVEALWVSRRQRRLDRYEQVVELATNGMGIATIARQVGVCVHTVKKYLKAETFPEHVRSTRRKAIDAFVPYLKKRWEEGSRVATELFEELRTQGFRGSLRRVRATIAPWRGDHEKRHRGKGQGLVGRHALVVAPSPRQTMWLLIRQPEDLEQEERAMRAAIVQGCEPLAETARLAGEFIQMVRDRALSAFEGWLEKVRGSGLEELKTFAQGLEKDRSAVEAALSTEISNGAVEGHVNKLKAIKRTMFGRAKFDLLRNRVLNAI